MSDLEYRKDQLRRINAVIEDLQDKKNTISGLVIGYNFYDPDEMASKFAIEAVGPILELIGSTTALQYHVDNLLDEYMSPDNAAEG
jgi:hypothetical protein